ncbi:DUF305 domain-containing protein [Pseudonocardia sp. CA-107938]|uniref:DUF305 domain-containing protein n=1 Tax=Pseudonocardia sp. CA-107938 TaxID=3240021 RepID=UPI003D913EC2
MKSKTIRAGLVAVLAAVLAACGGGAGAPAPAPSAAPVSAHNEADVTFAQGMIPHHQQAVEMAGLASSRAANDKVKQLAAGIGRAQAPEIEQMQGFLKAWGVQAAASTAAPMAPSTSMPMGGMDHGSMPSMGGTHGMMSDAQMAELEKASGAAFDRAFLQMMIDHHNGAVQMAGTEVKDGQSGDAKALAQKIIDAQKAEIAEMTTMLAEG